MAGETHARVNTIYISVVGFNVFTHSDPREIQLLNHFVNIVANIGCKVSQNIHQQQQINNKRVHLDVFVEMHGLVVDVMPHEEVVDTGQEGHLRQGENVHELLHGVAMGTLQDRDD